MEGTREQKEESGSFVSLHMGQISVCSVLGPRGVRSAFYLQGLWDQS